ncbi:MAG: hypothetical protein ABI678_30495 [Kofleriaceae bacterium]
MVVTGCSALAPGAECDCECARRIDRRDRLVTDDTTERVLVLHAAIPAAADALAVALGADALAVEIADASACGLPPPEDYDAIVLVARRGLLGHPRGLDAYLRAHRDALHDRVTWLVVVSRTANAVERWRETGWDPGHVASLTLPPARVRWLGEPLADQLASQASAIARAIGDALPASP